MAQYRTLEAVAYVENGAVVSTEAERIVELDDDQASALAGRVAPLVGREDSMFPDGNPIIAAHINRIVPVNPVAGEPAPVPSARDDKKDDKKPAPAK